MVHPKIMVFLLQDGRIQVRELLGGALDFGRSRPLGMGGSPFWDHFGQVLLVSLGALPPARFCGSRRSNPALLESTSSQPDHANSSPKELPAIFAWTLKAHLYTPVKHWGAKDQINIKDLTLWFQGPIFGGYQKSRFVGSLCLCGLWGP